MAIRKHLNHDTKTRERIQTSQLINRLQNHALGKCEMTSTQIHAARILLGKSLPDLTATQFEDVTNRSAEEMTDAELHVIAAGGG